MATKKTFKEMVNKVTLQGLLMESSLERRTDTRGKAYLAGGIHVMTSNDCIVPAEVFTYKIKNNGDANPLYDRLEKLVDFPTAATVGADDAPRVSITGARIQDNSFYSDRDNRIANNWRIGAAFINSVAKDAKELNEFEVEGVVASIKEVVGTDGESTGGYNLKLLNVGYGNRVNEVTLRFDEKEAIDYINNTYNVGDLVTLCGTILYEQKEVTKERPTSFGKPVIQTYTNTTRLLKITAGTEPVGSDEHEFKLKELQAIVVERNKEIEEKFKARAQNTKAATTKSVTNLRF